MQINFEVIAPQGAGCHFLRYWGSVGLDAYDGNDVKEVGYDVNKHWENNPIIPKDSKEKENPEFHGVFKQSSKSLECV